MLAKRQTQTEIDSWKLTCLNFSKQIKGLRLKNEMSFEKLSATTGIPLKILKGLERKPVHYLGNIGIEQLFILSKTFGVSLDVCLISGKNKSNSKSNIPLSHSEEFGEKPKYDISRLLHPTQYL